MDNANASAAVAKVAASKALDALVKFQWDDEELPYHDEMWFALRIGYVYCLARVCLLLKVLPNV